MLCSVQMYVLNIVIRLTFRSIHDAVSAAVDGDEIVLMAGIHNGLGKSIDVDKRLDSSSKTITCNRTTWIPGKHR